MNNNIYLKHLLEKITLKQSQLKTLNDTLMYYGSELDSKFQEIMTKNSINMSTINQQNCIHNANNANNTNDNIIMNDYKQICDLLFKQLALITHLDKSGDAFAQEFINIKKAFDDENIIELLGYANKYELLNNKLDDLNINMVTVILEKELSKLRKDITKLRSSVGYNMLVEGNIDNYIETLKDNMRMVEENEKMKKKIEELEKRNKDI